MLQTANRYHTQLMENPNALNYLLSRGLSMKSITDFKFGLSLSNKEEIKHFKADDKDMRSEWFAKFSDRIMIPLNNVARMFLRLSKST